jgi:hypothetical protein
VVGEPVALEFNIQNSKFTILPEAAPPAAQIPSVGMIITALWWVLGSKKSFQGAMDKKCGIGLIL